MITIEEKVKLLKAVGADRAAYDLEVDQIAKADIARLTSMKFKRVTKAEVEEKVGTYFYFDREGQYIVNAILSGCLGGCIGGAIGIFYHLHFLFFVIPIFCALTGGSLSATGISDVDWESLSKWRWELPYGACLAIKEAMDAGLGGFRICYPTTNEALMRKDPIIVGYSKGGMFEVFAWDAGKIYE